MFPLRRRCQIFLSSLGLAFAFAGPASAFDQPPTLDSFANLTPIVDPSGGGANVLFDLGITDANPGVCLSACDDAGTPSQLTLLHPASGQRLTGRLTPTGAPDLYRATVAFDGFDAGGSWIVESLWLADRSGNRRFFSTSDLNTLGYATGVTSLASSGDQTPPSFTNVVQSATTFTSDPGATLLVEFQPYDGSLCSPPSCALEGPASQVRFVHAATGQRRTAFIRRELVFQGGGFGFVNRARVVFPSGSAGGLWTPEWAELVDGAGNRATLDASALGALGAMSVLNITTLGDEIPPSQATVDWVPDPIDSSGGSVVALFGIDAYDPGTGLCLEPDDCSDFGGVSQVVYKRDGAAHRRFASLIDNGGDFYLTGLTIPRSGSADVWRPDQLMLVDRVGNRRIPEPGFSLALLIACGAALGLAGRRGRASLER